MPIQSLAEFVDDPDGIGSSVCSKMESSRSSRAIRRQTIISQKALQEKFLIQTEGNGTFDCMFCDESYKRHQELGKHVLAKHKATLCEPTVLRVDAEYLSPQDERRKSAGSPVEEIKEDHESSDCEVCGQIFIDSTALETHLKTHKDSFTYSCNICGRRFKEPWFLKNHKRTHSTRSGGKNKQQPGTETPATINEIVQESVAREVTSPYKMCMVCGFIYLNKESLLEHSKIHIKGSKPTGTPTNLQVSSKENIKEEVEEDLPKEEFLNFLNLKPSKPPAKNPEPSCKCIGELDPFNTYQAWQLATKGKVALGYGQVKEPLFEINMETDSSDKDETIELWNTGKISQSAHADETESVNSEGAAPSQDPDLRNPNQEMPYTEGDAKPSNDQQRSSICNDCGKRFKTCHQLILHSRIHRKDRNDSESSTVSSSEGLLSMGSSDTPTSLEDHETIKIQNESESKHVGGDAVLTDKSNNVEANLKIKGLPTSRECSYCGKTFRSNYYLNIHLRTHTGEKPYDCDFCGYSAAQKTSLRYHLEKHHKFKPGESNARVKSIGKGVQLLKRSPDPRAAKNKEQESQSSQKAISDTNADCNLTKPPKRLSALRNRLVNAKQFLKRKNTAKIKEEPKTLVPDEERAVTPGQPSHVEEEVSLTCEETFDQETSTVEEKTSLDQSKDLTLHNPGSVLGDELTPLDMCVKPADNLSTTLDNSALLAVHVCPHCAYKTLYLEVLMMHQRLNHKRNYEQLQKNSCRNKNPAHITKMRRTGCPPSLKGVDVPPGHPNVSRLKVFSSSTQPKAPPNDKPKRTPVLSNKGVNSLTDSKSVEQENKSHLVHHNGQQAGRYMQPDLQGITHLLERMQQPEQQWTPWRAPPSSQQGSTNGSMDHPYQILPSWYGEHSFTRTGAAPGEPLTKRGKHNIAISPSTSCLNADMVNRLHPSQVNIHNQERASTKSGTSLLPTNMSHPYEVDPCNLMKSYEHPPAGSLLRIGNTSCNQGSSTSSIDGKSTSFRQLSKRGFGPKEKKA